MMPLFMGVGHCLVASHFYSSALEVITIIHLANGTQVFESKSKSQQDDFDRWWLGPKTSELARPNRTSYPTHQKIKKV